MILFESVADLVGKGVEARTDVVVVMVDDSSVESETVGGEDVHLPVDVTLVVVTKVGLVVVGA